MLPKVKMSYNFIDNILIAVQEASFSKRASFLEIPNSIPNSKKQEHFVIFTKPELLESGSQGCIRQILREFVKRFEQLKVDIIAVRVFNGKYVRDRKLIDSCYKRLNEVSRQGIKACSNIHKLTISEYFIKHKNLKARIVGGDEFLKIYPEHSATELGNIVDRLGCFKIGAGIYGTSISVSGDKLLLLNGFYPAQRDRLSSGKVPMIAFLLTSDSSPRLIRRHLIGDILPQRALSKSLRGICFRLATRFGIENINISRNCIHYSANSMDACLYEKLIFGRVRSSNRFLQMAHKQGVEVKKMWKLYNSKVLRRSGRWLDLRDQIEDVSTKECFRLVHELLNRKRTRRSTYLAKRRLK